jgi:hypothetical protein
MLIKKIIPGFFNGVSQQPSSTRLDTQCELEENMLGTLVDGLIKRPNTEYVAKLTSLVSSNSFMHAIDRDNNEHYIMAITGDDTTPIEVYTLDGTACNVIYTDDALDYFVSETPNTDFSATTIADYTIAVNKSKLTALTTTPGDSHVPTALIYVSRGMSSTDYKVFIDEVEEASYTTDDTSNPDSFKTTTIAGELYSDLVVNLTQNHLVIEAPTTFVSTSYNPSNMFFTVKVQDIVNPSQYFTVATNIAYDYETTPGPGPTEYTHTIDQAATMTALYNAVTANINHNYYEVNLINNNLLIKKINATSFICEVLGKSHSTVTYPSEVNSIWDLDYDEGTNCIKIRRTDAAEFKIRVSDTWGDQALLGIKDTVQSFTNLPPRAYDNFMVQITGNSDNRFSSYYVKYVTNEYASSGVWKETVKDGMYNNIDGTTMPHQIVRTGVNEFTVSKIDWKERKIGDEYSAPNPSFIGDYIKDVFFFQNRLGFLAGENVVLSKASDYFNFFPTTALDVLDDDPIDVAVSTTQVNILHSANPFNENLLLDSNLQQFLLTAGNNLLTPKTVQIKPITKYATSSNCKPAAAGTNLYFVVPVNNFSSVREYYVAPDTYTTDAADITAHVDKYLPSNISSLIANTTTNMLFAFSTDEPNSVYHYSFLWQGNEKIQSSWKKWTFDDTILGMVSLESFLYMLVKKTDSSEICLVKMALSPIKTADLNYRIYLDKSVTLTGSYDSETGKTTWTLPYTDSSDLFIVTNIETGNQLLSVTKTTDTTFEAVGDYSSSDYLIGKTYIGRHRFSEWFVKDKNGVGDIEGRLQIKKLILQFINTGPFKVEVTPYRRTKITHDFTGFILGYSYFGSPTLITGSESFLILANAKNSTIDLVCESYLPVQFVLAEFVGMFDSAARMI